MEATTMTLRYKTKRSIHNWFLANCTGHTSVAPESHIDEFALLSKIDKSSWMSTAFDSFLHLTTVRDGVNSGLVIGLEVDLRRGKGYPPTCFDGIDKKYLTQTPPSLRILDMCIHQHYFAFWSKWGRCLCKPRYISTVDRCFLSEGKSKSFGYTVNRAWLISYPTLVRHHA